MICGKNSSMPRLGGDDADVVERQHQHFRVKEGAQHAEPMLRLDLAALVGHPPIEPVALPAGGSRQRVIPSLPLM
jgi:hypothetical protein